MIPAGQRDQRITIQSSAATNDDHGQPVLAWTDVVTVWAKAAPIRGREFFAAEAAHSEATVKFSILYRSGVTSSMRVLWRSVPYVLVADPIDVDGGQHTLELMCSSGPRAA